MWRKIIPKSALAVFLIPLDVVGGCREFGGAAVRGGRADDWIPFRGVRHFKFYGLDHAASKPQPRVRSSHEPCPLPNPHWDGTYRHPEKYSLLFACDPP